MKYYLITTALYGRKEWIRSGMYGTYPIYGPYKNEVVEVSARLYVVSRVLSLPQVANCHY